MEALLALFYSAQLFLSALNATQSLDQPMDSWFMQNKVVQTKDDLVVYKNVLVYSDQGTYSVDKASILEPKWDTPKIIYDYPELESWALSDKKGYLFLIDKRYKLPPNYKPKDLVFFKDKVLGRTLALRKQAYYAFIKMAQDAKKQGHIIYIYSAFRSYDTQKNLFDGYVTNFGLEYSKHFVALPGHSQHQTGQAIDIGVLYNNEPYYLRAVTKTPAYEWLKQNAYKYGFVFPYVSYTGKDITQVTGYIPEPWHLFYIGDQEARLFVLSRLEFMQYVKHKLKDFNAFPTL